ncbi:hypothetical protein ID866_8457 [Astraeus odoratus]|nr:hypothetical protein ID866_8457 [Astraeus odoratus]
MMIQATYREIHVWSKLRHENILPLLGIATKFDRTISLVTEWMPLGNAHDYVQDRSIDPRPLVAQLLHIARGLCYLHEHEPGSIVHGDVKGVNVLISGDGRAVLADFGLSLLINSSFSMTVNPPCGGSWRWLAPENVDSQEYAITHAGDIWAFGMTSLELFTGQNPFPDIQTIQRLVLRILRGPPERPSDEWTYSRMTDDWWELLCSCWQRGPLLRPSMSELVSTIEQLELSGHGIN